MYPTRLLTLLVALVCLTLVTLHNRRQQEYLLSSLADISLSASANSKLRLIGPVAMVEEAESGLGFNARIDTGATRCSLHTDQWEIPGAASTMNDNVGKTIRFRISTPGGQSSWLERKIAEVAEIRTSEKAELRYLVPLELNLDGVSKTVLVSLNDRSQMTHPLLVGRNFLAGHFLVDVSADDQLLVGHP